MFFEISITQAASLPAAFKRSTSPNIHTTPILPFTTQSAPRPIYKSPKVLCFIFLTSTFCHSATDTNMVA